MPNTKRPMKVEGGGSTHTRADHAHATARLTSPPTNLLLPCSSISKCNYPNKTQQEIANYLGMELGKVVIKKFADGEVYVQIQESIRGCDVFLAWAATAFHTHVS